MDGKVTNSSELKSLRKGFFFRGFMVETKKMNAGPKGNAQNIHVLSHRTVKRSCKIGNKH